MKPGFIHFITSAIVVAFLTVSCQKELICEGCDPATAVVDTPLVQAAPNIYVCGQHQAKAVYWKNGKEFVLGQGDAESTATSIAVAGDVVYTAGDIGDLFKYVTNQAVYWRSNQMIALTGETGAGTSGIVVSNGDVFVSGWEYKGANLTAVYWKNGVKTALTDGSVNAEATGIAVVGVDVYVAGHENGVAKYWKNGTPIALTNGVNQSLTHGIAVVNGDVYVAGAEAGGSNMIAKYWKNGQAVAITDGQQWAVATSISVNGNDVYVAGYEGGFYNSVAKFWKNGQATAVSSLPGTGYAKAISFFKGDVYVAGYNNGPNQFAAIYWKNKDAIPLTGSIGSWATGIVVKAP
jgi:hypothetical protein